MDKDNKHIDQLFKEGFSGMDAAPPEDAWENIERALDKKSNDRVVPLWIRLAGAAMVAALLGLGYFFQSGPIQESPSNQVVDSDETPTHIDGGSETQGNKSSIQQHPTTADNKEPVAEYNAARPAKKSSDTKDSSAKSNDLKRNIPDAKNRTSSSEEFAVSSGNIVRENSRDEQSPVTRKQENIIPAESDVEQGYAAGRLQEIENHTYKLTADDPILGRDKADKQPIGNDAMASNEKVQEVDSTITDKKLDLQEYADNQNDEKKDEQKSSILNTRWYLSSSVSPVLAHTIGGSSIDPQFADNPKNPGINLSYGVNLGYQISDKLTLRSGVMNTTMNYSTGDIAYTVTTDGENKFRAGQNGPINIVVRDASSRNASNGNDVDKEFPSSGNTSDYEGEINQQLSYIEVPMELDYKLLDNKFSLHLVGGFSTLFLNKNNIIITNGPDRFELGEDPTFNQLNFSLNTGFGVGYDLTRQLGVRVEPQFKYQIRAQNNNPADFRPFTLGLHTGIFYRF